MQTFYDFDVDLFMNMQSAKNLHICYTAAE